MPSYDRGCTHCDYYIDFVIEKWDAPNPSCPLCGAATERKWRAGYCNIIRDEFAVPVIDNVMDRTETLVFHTKSERNRAMRERGLEEFIRHVGVPGTDKSEHTKTWDIKPAYLTEADEQERLERWLSDELAYAQEQFAHERQSEQGSPLRQNDRDDHGRERRSHDQADDSPDERRSADAAGVSTVPVAAWLEGSAVL